MALRSGQTDGRGDDGIPLGLIADVMLIVRRAFGAAEWQPLASAAASKVTKILEAE